MKKVIILTMFILGLGALSAVVPATKMDLLPTSLVWAVDTEDVFGRLEAPPGTERFQAQMEDSQDIALILFLSRMITLAAVVAGLWVFLNVILAGYHYIFAGGDSGTHTKVKDYLTNSALGILLILTAYTIAAILGLLIFGDATFILNPVLEGPRTSL